VRVLLVSTYELGHQPLHLAAPAAALRGAGHDVTLVDTSVDPFDPTMVDSVDAVAFSVPMHTATRLAVAAATAVKKHRLDVPVCFYGLYAAMGEGVADRLIGGEYVDELLAWVGGAAPTAVLVPWRNALPSLSRYGRLVIDGEERAAGYVEASRGCVHRCRHCPVPVVYDGRIRIVDVESVVADVAQQVAAGARHITFGDPDFLNGPHHARRVVEAVHAAFPDVTFDCTTKVEHILRHRDIWRGMARAGCVFVVSAFESVNNDILRRLDKGHTVADEAKVVTLLRDAGIPVRPSWLPFTPWTVRDDIVALLDFVTDQELVASVDPVQYTIRLLLPRGSLLLDGADFAVGPFDDDRLAYTWSSPLDGLHATLAALVEEATARDEPRIATYHRIRAAVGAPPVDVADEPEPPRLTEPWFCCAEPTDLQLQAVSSTAAAGAPPTHCG
jgi:radical SAM superfamily enzyme YgiQ (UPF0313 family)